MAEHRAARPHPDPGEGALRGRSRSVPGLVGRVGPAVVGLVVASATVVVALVDPREVTWYPRCPLLALTGLACPLCGGLRATHDLARLDVAGAWASNPWWVLVVGVLVVVGAAQGLRRLRSRGGSVRADPRPRTRARLVLAVVATGAAFAVLRNLPGLSVLLGPG